MQTLPTQDIDVNAIYLVPIADPQTSDNYAEYIYLNGVWEKLGETPIEIDLTDYVKNTDYATGDKGGVIKTDSSLYGSHMIDGKLCAGQTSYANYQNKATNFIIGKGTLENVITGKGLVNNTDYATDSTAGVIKVGGFGASARQSSTGVLYALSKTITEYNEASNNAFISKGTLENVITGKGLVSNTDYATGTVGGVLKQSSGRKFALDENGYPMVNTVNYADYGSLANGAFIGKGTLENVLSERYKPQVVLTQAQYDQITPDANTLYIITGA